MTYEGLSTRRGEQSLAPLVGLSDLLDRRNGQLVVTDKLQVPISEHGIPLPRELIEQVLASVAVRHHWTGHYDVHHVAWPEAEYKRINKETGSVLGGQYRGTAALKIRLPRQLHNYIHTVTEPPAIPDADVMEQWVREKWQVDRLYDTVSLKSMSEFDMPETEREKYRFSNFQQKLEDMEDGHLGLMPEREDLAAMEITQARRALRAIARVQGFTNNRLRQPRFFTLPLPA